jgi:hypothetical protein
VSAEQQVGRDIIGNPTSEGNVMGREARIALLLTASASLLAVMIEWVIGELNRDERASSQ